MDHQLLPQLTALLLLIATPAALKKGLPSTEPLSKAFSTFIKSFRFERPRRRDRSRAMRGARPWWE
jgi:hypothetical protein